jgi:hypothetical protein
LFDSPCYFDTSMTEKEIFPSSYIIYHVNDALTLYM